MSILLLLYNRSEKNNNLCSNSSVRLLLDNEINSKRLFFCILNVGKNLDEILLYFELQSPWPVKEYEN